MLLPLTPHEQTPLAIKTTVHVFSDTPSSLEEKISILCPGLTVARTEKGKPYFTDSSLFLSATDSDRYYLVAISDRPVGIDLQIQKKVRAEALSSRYFHPQEQEWIRNAPAEMQLDRFYTVWTAKEAYVKYTGQGIDESFGKFSVFSVPEAISVGLFDEKFTLAICQEELLPVVF